VLQPSSTPARRGPRSPTDASGKSSKANSVTGRRHTDAGAPIWWGVAGLPSPSPPPGQGAVGCLAAPTADGFLPTVQSGPAYPASARVSWLGRGGTRSGSGGTRGQYRRRQAWASTALRLTSLKTCPRYAFCICGPDVVAPQYRHMALGQSHVAQETETVVSRTGRQTTEPRVRHSHSIESSTGAGAHTSSWGTVAAG